MYSKEKFEQNIDQTKKVEAEISGEKSVTELLDLVAQKETLEIEREQLFGKANTEARLMNIIFDLENKNPFNNNSQLSLNDFVLDYASETIALNPEKEAEITGLYDITESILQEDILEESGFEKFTDALEAIKTIRTDLPIDSTRLPEQTSDNLSSDVELDIEENESSSFEVVSINFPINRLENALKKSFQLKVKNSAGDIYYPEVAPHEFYDTLNSRHFSKTDISTIIKACPKSLEVRETRSGKHVLTEESIQKWATAVSSAYAKLPSIPQDEDGSSNIALPNIDSDAEIADIDEFLPPGYIDFRITDDAGGQIGGEGKKNYATISDPVRVQFLKDLSPNRTIVARFARKNRKFNAFVFERGDRQIAVIALDKTNNADYIFWADTDEWIDYASTHSKEEICSSNNHIFLGRLVHSGGWQSRFTEFLSEKSDTVKT